MSLDTGEEIAVNLGLVIITLRTRSEIHSSVMADVVSCSYGCRKYLGKMHIPRPQEEKKTQKQTEITTRATCGSPSNKTVANLINARVQNACKFVIKFATNLHGSKFIANLVLNLSTCKQICKFVWKPDACKQDERTPENRKQT